MSKIIVVRRQMCEVCGNRISPEWPLILATWDDNKFRPVNSEKYSNSASGNPMLTMGFCTIEHGIQIAKEGQFILKKDIDPCVGIIECYDHNGIIQDTFWTK